MEVRVQRSALNQSVHESAGWSVYSHLDDSSHGVATEEFLSGLTDIQRAVVVLGRVHLECQMEGVQTMLGNIELVIVKEAVHGAEIIGRADVAVVLREVLALLPTDFGESGFDRFRWLDTNAGRTDEWRAVEDAWFAFGIDLEPFIEEHASEFLLD